MFQSILLCSFLTIRALTGDNETPKAVIKEGSDIPLTRLQFSDNKLQRRWSFKLH
jgi:hypothetical protein